MRWSDDELNVAMNGRVAAVLFDDMGKSNIEEVLAGVTGTDFVQDGLRRLLEDPDTVEDWRVGEAIAETYLSDHRSCSFPWPGGRDERKRGSSLPGSDLVGFGSDTYGTCFIFGEVKTSSDSKYPPGIMYGRAGLKQQLEDLCDCQVIRDDLVKYLGHRAGSTPWQEQYERAASRYLRNSSDVKLYGFLVRDVEPNKDDLQARVNDLGNGHLGGTFIELLALYLPQGRLTGIGEEMVSRRSGVG